ncbi:MAG: response regulator [Desulfobulbaceae bacterium]|nr:response regulator [Desulfobulbaceae bacterium]
MTEPQKARILVVDDTEFNRIILVSILHKQYTVIEAGGGKQALAMAHAERPDLILLDIMMPEMDGFEVCRILKEDPATRDIPVIFITALKGAENASKGFEAGAVDYITKPFDSSEILARLKTHLALLRAREELQGQNLLLQKTIAEQMISIDLAKRIMQLINGLPPRYVFLPNEKALCIEAITSPCHIEGGDHYFVRTLESPAGQGKTIFSIKDQSGHEVACILRSIITDLAHNSLLGRTRGDLEETVGALNKAICASGIFAADAFCTALTAELDHKTMRLRYLAAGHPPFLLVRGGVVSSLPQPGAVSNNLPIATLPDAAFTAEAVTLAPGDKLIFYTDGLIEMPEQNRHHRLSRQDLEQLLTDLVAKNPELGVAALLRQLLAAVAALSEEEVVPFSANSSADDVSLLGIEVEDWNCAAEMVITPAATGDLDRFAAAIYEKMEPELKRRGFVDPEIRIGMPLSEALINAWKHGNRCAPDKEITVRWRFGNDFVLEVIDQGDGFVPERIADPTGPGNLDKPAGRGIFIIRRYAYSLQWRRGGRHLVAAFTKNPDPQRKEQEATAIKLFQLW